MRVSWRREGVGSNYQNSPSPPLFLIIHTWTSYLETEGYKGIQREGYISNVQWYSPDQGLLSKVFSRSSGKQGENGDGWVKGKHKSKNLNVKPDPKRWPINYL